jgi:hypothetical protein
MSRKVIGRGAGVCARTKVQAGATISATMTAARRAAKSETFMASSKVRMRIHSSRMRDDYMSVSSAALLRASGVIALQPVDDDRG